MQTLLRRAVVPASTAVLLLTGGCLWLGEPVHAKGGCEPTFGSGEHTLEAVRGDAMSRYEVGDHAVFVALMEAVAAHSDDPVDDYNLACGYALVGRTDDALAKLTELVELGATWDFAQDEDFRSLHARPEFARLLARVAFHEEADRRLEPVRDVAMAQYHAGNHAAFVDIMEKVSTYSNQDQDLYNLACGYALVGRLDDAIGALERLATRGADFGAASDGDFAALRDDPRFHAVLARLAG